MATGFDDNAMLELTEEYPLSGSLLRSVASFGVVVIVLNVFIAVLVEGYSLAVEDDEDNGDIHHIYYSLMKEKVGDARRALMRYLSSHRFLHLFAKKVHPGLSVSPTAELHNLDAVHTHQRQPGERLIRVRRTASPEPGHHHGSRNSSPSRQPNRHEDSAELETMNETKDKLLSKVSEKDSHPHHKSPWPGHHHSGHHHLGHHHSGHHHQAQHNQAHSSGGDASLNARPPQAEIRHGLIKRRTTTRKLDVDAAGMHADKSGGKASAGSGLKPNSIPHAKSANESSTAAIQVWCAWVYTHVCACVLARWREGVYVHECAMCTCEYAVLCLCACMHAYMHSCKCMHVNACM